MSENYAGNTVPRQGDSERQLLVRILNALNAGAGGGTGAGWLQGAYGNYGGAAPPWTPVGSNLGVAIDTSTGQVWWYTGSWN